MQQRGLGGSCTINLAIVAVIKTMLQTTRPRCRPHGKGSKTKTYQYLQLCFSNDWISKFNESVFARLKLNICPATLNSRSQAAASGSWERCAQQFRQLFQRREKQGWLGHENRCLCKLQGTFRRFAFERGEKFFINPPLTDSKNFQIVLQ